MPSVKNQFINKVDQSFYSKHSTKQCCKRAFDTASFDFDIKKYQNSQSKHYQPILLIQNVNPLNSSTKAGIHVTCLTNTFSINKSCHQCVVYHIFLYKSPVTIRIPCTHFYFLVCMNQDPNIQVLIVHNGSCTCRQHTNDSNSKNLSRNTQENGCHVDDIFNRVKVTRPNRPFQSQLYILAVTGGYQGLSVPLHSIAGVEKIQWTNHHPFQLGPFHTAWFALLAWRCFYFSKWTLAELMKLYSPCTLGSTIWTYVWIDSFHGWNFAMIYRSWNIAELL